jgi:hypothetical protein
MWKYEDFFKAPLLKKWKKFWLIHNLRLTFAMFLFLKCLWAVKSINLIFASFLCQNGGFAVILYRISNCFQVSSSSVYLYPYWVYKKTLYAQLPIAHSCSWPMKNSSVGLLFKVWWRSPHSCYFYVPEGSFAYLTVSSWFLISFVMGRLCYLTALER